MFGMIGAYLLGRSDGRRAAQRRRQKPLSVADVQIMRGVALLIFVCALAIVIAFL